MASWSLHPSTEMIIDFQLYLPALPLLQCHDVAKGNSQDTLESTYIDGEKI